MRRAAAGLTLACVLATAGPARAWDQSSAPTANWTFFSIRGTYAYTEGVREGHVGTSLVGVPYSDQAVGAELEIEHYDSRHPGGQDWPDYLGLALGLRFVARIGGVLSADYAHPAGVSAVSAPQGWAAPVRMSIGFGTLAQIIRANDFVLAAHFSLELLASRATWSPDVAFVLFPGLRMVWQPTPVRFQLAYDCLPFWIGQGRLEHRASAAIAFQLGSVGLGVRFTYTIGQDQRVQGGLDDMTYGGALELVL